MSDQNEFSDGPPCLERLAADGQISNRPQDVLRQLAIYARQKHAATFEERLLDYRSLFAEPPTFAMIKQAIKDSGGRRSSYDCKSGPCAQLCEHTRCTTRRYGVTGGEHMGFRFGVLTKHVVKDPGGRDTKDEPFFTWVINELDVHFETIDHLCSQTKFRRTVAAVVNRVPPDVSGAQHTRFIRGALQAVVEERLPFEAGVDGTIMAALMGFLLDFGKATCWEDVHNGMAWLRLDDDGRWRGYFHWSALSGHMDRQYLRRGLTHKRTDIWAALRKYGNAETGRANYRRRGGKLRWWRVDLPADFVCPSSGGPVPTELAATETE